MNKAGGKNAKKLSNDRGDEWGKKMSKRKTSTTKKTSKSLSKKTSKRAMKRLSGGAVEKVSSKIDKKTSSTSNKSRGETKYFIELYGIDINFKGGKDNRLKTWKYHLEKDPGIQLKFSSEKIIWGKVIKTILEYANKGKLRMRDVKKVTIIKNKKSEILDGDKLGNEVNLENGAKIDEIKIELSN